MLTTSVIDCELNYEVFTSSTFVFKIETALRDDQQIHQESLCSVPARRIDRHCDELGNRSCRVEVAPGPFSIRYQATVSRCTDGTSAHERGECPVEALPLDVLPFLCGSRYVESELLFNDALRWIGSHDRGTARVRRICAWVAQNIRYEIGTSLPNGTALDALARRTGVCRDFAHVAIALCRALNIPARFVVGHVLWDTPPPDFHALFEAYLGDRWVLFDPTGMAATDDVIRIGTGLDAATLPFATIFGSACMARMSPLVFRALSDGRMAA